MSKKKNAKKDKPGKLDHKKDVQKDLEKKGAKKKSKGKGSSKKDAKKKQKKSARKSPLGNCTCCKRHCPLSKPKCSKGRRLAEALAQRSK